MTIDFNFPNHSHTKMMIDVYYFNHLRMVSMEIKRLSYLFNKHLMATRRAKKIIAAHSIIDKTQSAHFT